MLRCQTSVTIISNSLYSALSMGYPHYVELDQLLADSSKSSSSDFTVCKFLIKDLPIVMSIEYRNLEYQNSLK